MDDAVRPPPALREGLKRKNGRMRTRLVTAVHARAATGNLRPLMPAPLRIPATPDADRNDRAPGVYLTLRPDPTE